MTYPESLSSLGQARRFGMKLGLEPMQELAGALGDPQNGLRFIHLAGTNGKGSTAAFCESCLRHAGYRVGLYTSPHLVGIRERIQVNRCLITESDFAKGIETIHNALARLGNGEATFFEQLTALALWHFAREKVDWVVWETGLGGRLDATTIIRPEICIITNIGMDHQKYLGDTLEAIAGEKAGILKPRVPVISAVEAGVAQDVIRDHAREFDCDLTLVPRDLAVEDLGPSGHRERARIAGREFTLGLVGAHQVDNAACAVAAMQRMGVSASAIATGLENTVWSGRFEILSETPLIVLDGAHNPAGARRLAETWRGFLAERFGWTTRESDGRAHLVFAAASDKDVTELVEILSPLANRVSLVRLANERGAEPVLLESFFPDLPCTCYDSVADLWRSLAEVHSQTLTIAAGSLFLVGEMLAQRQGSAEEYRLNERLEVPTTIR